ncbi:hypothetical protein EBF04_26150 [Streptomyces sp. I6]|nr:hypothetical protein EBF04_26150 [Streptomyces sp. I6]
MAAWASRPPGTAAFHGEEGTVLPGTVPTSATVLLCAVPYRPPSAEEHTSARRRGDHAAYSRPGAAQQLPCPAANRAAPLRRAGVPRRKAPP